VKKGEGQSRLFVINAISEAHNLRGLLSLLTEILEQIPQKRAMQHVMLEGAVMQIPTASSCRACHLKSWNGVERCNRGVLASTSSKVGDFCTVIVGLSQVFRTC